MNIPEDHTELLLAYIEAVDAVDRLYDENQQLKSDIELKNRIIGQFKNGMDILNKQEAI